MSKTPDRCNTINPQDGPIQSGRAVKDRGGIMRKDRLQRAAKPSTPYWQAGKPPPAPLTGNRGHRCRSPKPLTSLDFPSDLPPVWNRESAIRHSLIKPSG
jgi:hypothetical protein